MHTMKKKHEINTNVGHEFQVCNWVLLNRRVYMFAKLVQLVSLPLASIAYMAKPPYYSRGDVQINMYSEIKKKPS